MRIASAHKTPLKVLKIIEEYEKDAELFITVAGRSNALSGFVDANTTKPVIACPPYSERFGGADIYSTLRMPSGVSPLTVLEPEQAALATAKILGLKYPEIAEKVQEYQKAVKEDLDRQDKELTNG